MFQTTKRSFIAYNIFLIRVNWSFHIFIKPLNIKQAFIDFQDSINFYMDSRLILRHRNVMQFFGNPERGTKYGVNVLRLKGSILHLPIMSLAFISSLVVSTRNQQSKFELGTRSEKWEAVFTVWFTSCNDKIKIKQTCLHLARDLTRLERL